MKVKPKNSDFDQLYSESAANTNAKKIIHRANTRGSADHGWLKVNHSFSFAEWHNPEKIHFGALRVLNDDRIAPGKGFGTHPHDNMEIITIPLEGSLAHKDSMGNASTITAGEVQLMSAGEGVLHSEYNPNENLWTSLFQIWIFPNKKNVTPRYDQFSIDVSKMKNQFLQILSPSPEDEGGFIHQNAWIKMAEFDREHPLQYNLNSTESGVYTMIIEGEANVEGEILAKRDAIGIWDQSSINFTTNSVAKVLVIEVPMKF